MSLRLRLGQDCYTVDIDSEGRASVGGPSVSGQALHVQRLDHTTVEVRSEAEGWRRIVYVAAADDGAGWSVFCEGDVFEIVAGGDEPTLSGRAEAPASLASPMPATVRTVHVSVGQSVRAGDPLILLEAMKMELAVKAPRHGTVASVTCRAGDLVKAGVPLVVLAPVS